MRSISNYNILLYLILVFSLFLGFIYGEDSGGTGSILDFKITWQLIEDPFNLENLRRDIKFPLHYYIGSLIYKIVNNINVYKLFYVFITCFLPLIFFKILEIRYPGVNKNNLFLLSLILLILPHVRSAAIWPNTQITAIFFFLFALYNFLKLIKIKDYSNLNKYLFLTLIFLSLLVYTRQIYAVFYLYFVYFAFNKYPFKIFLKICFIITLFAIPGIVFIFMHPEILISTFTLNIQNSILINLSIISFYLIPFYFISIVLKIYKIKFDFKLNFLVTILFITILTLIEFSSINTKMWGGFFLKLSLLLFSNLYLFFITSIVGLILIVLLCNKKINNIVLSLLIILGIASYSSQQKYFEPMMFLLIFLIYENKIIEKFVKNNNAILLIFIYYSIYFASAILNLIFKIKENLMLNI